MISSLLDLPPELQNEVCLRVISFEPRLRLVCRSFAMRFQWMAQLTAKKRPDEVVRGMLTLLRSLARLGKRRIGPGLFLVMLHGRAFQATCCSAWWPGSSMLDNARSVLAVIEERVDGALIGLSDGEMQVFAAFAGHIFSHADVIVRRDAGSGGWTVRRIFESRGVACQ